MNTLPGTPNPGSPPAPSVWFRQSVDHARAVMARLAAVEARIARPTTASANPGLARWQLFGFIDGGAAKIRVGVGMVNNFVPTIGGVSLAAVTPPTLTVTGASGVVYLRATIDGAGTITALEILSAASIPADTTTGTLYKHKLLGTWTASGGAFTSVNSVLNMNQTFRMCGGNAEWY